jgi:hypothetical protein
MVDFFHRSARQPETDYLSEGPSTVLSAASPIAISYRR